MLNQPFIESQSGMGRRPLYNIKAVAEATGLTAATLRAWERRYGALSPGRTQSGYRLYSDHDVARLHWLKARVAEGLSISQAFAMLALRETAPTLRPAPPLGAGGGLASARQWLLSALLAFDEAAADAALAEAFAAYGPEAVGESIIAPLMAQIGEGWQRGTISTPSEHFASNTLRRKLDAIISAAPRHDHGRLVVLGCAPDDWHELGLLLLYMFLRRRGLNVVYLGQSVPVEQFVPAIRRLHPALVVISAATEAAVAGLVELARCVAGMEPPRPQFAFGGSIFNERPDLRTAAPGVFLGESARAAADRVVSLLSDDAEAPH